MSKICSLVHAFALIACICVVAPPSLANLAGGVEGWFEGGGVRQCLGSMVGVGGCIEEVMSSVMRVEAGLVGAACCNAFLQIDQSCWPKMFPFTITFPSQLKNHCLNLPHHTPPFPSCSYEDADDHDDDDNDDCDDY
ncbi:hypothetical protein C2S51_010790 [Perilla frutescens var. frutescens]|nr:hypothetical protein C2S51_010790 [Perilla frutescens var. frutescens]